MRPEYKHTSHEAAERERRHQFGQPEGNKLGDPRKAANQRDFYRWAEGKATEEELKAYVKDTANPYARRRFVAALVKCDTVQDFFELTNQTHGQPKQTIEQTNLPEVQIILE
jgi:hypothetical protein